MAEPLIAFQNVHKSFGDNAVLKGVDLAIEAGQVTAIIGRSGIGKSVMLKHVIGLLAPDRGAILLQGKDITRPPRRARRALKGRFSYMFQHMALFDSMTLYDNIALPLRERTKLSSTEIRARVTELAALMEVQDALAQYPSQISGGMSKRVAFARALVTEPEIVLFDEPTTGLDPIRKNRVHAMIAAHQKEKGFTAVVVSHDIPDVFGITDKVALLEDGIIIAEGTAEAIQASRDPRVRGFIEGQGELKESA